MVAGVRHTQKRFLRSTIESIIVTVVGSLHVLIAVGMQSRFEICRWRNARTNMPGHARFITVIVAEATIDANVNGVVILLGAIVHDGHLFDSIGVERVAHQTTKEP